MTNIVGGLRDRLIIEAVRDHVEDALDELGWLTPSTGRLDVTVLVQEVDPSDPIEPNLVAIFADDQDSAENELGTNRTEMTRSFWVDVYGEDESIGEHLSGDIRDVLLGKMPSIGYDRPIIPVFDARQATPPILFYCDVEDVEKERGHNPANDTQRHWWSVSFTLVDSYTDDEDD